MGMWSPFTVAALRAASAAGDIQRRLFGRLARVEYKGWHDPVTEADRSSEDAIVSILRGAFPDHAFLGEERGPRGAGAYTWLIDPLDGTHNYSRAFPWFGISIALRDDTRILAGVVHNPLLGDVFAAERGRGAYAAITRDLPADAAGWADLSLWRKISVSQTQALREATLATGFPPTVADTRLNVDHFVNLLLAAARVRAIGSAALSLSAVAAGQMDGYWEIGPKVWDFAAGALLVEEAGGRVSDLRGRSLDSYEGQLLATNGHIHAEVGAVLSRGRSGLD